MEAAPGALVPASCPEMLPQKLHEDIPQSIWLLGANPPPTPVDMPHSPLPELPPKV